jgi:hypothetical protein
LKKGVQHITGLICFGLGFAAAKPFLAARRTGEGRRPGTIGAYLYNTPGSQRAHFVGPGRASCGSDAAQSPYSGRQNPLMPHKRLRYSRDIIRNKSLKYTENAAIRGGVKKYFWKYH